MELRGRRTGRPLTVGLFLISLTLSLSVWMILLLLASAIILFSSAIAVAREEEILAFAGEIPFMCDQEIRENDTR